jgi:polysaccharide pyruvyl transferase WcaK-like protein
LHDAITAEKAGVPAAAIMTDAFVDIAHALAQACGMPGYPFAVIRHPIAPDGDEALRQKAAEALHQCQELLLRS